MSDVTTIYIEKDAYIRCSLSELTEVTKVILRANPGSSRIPSTSWLPNSDWTLDLSKLSKKDQQKIGTLRDIGWTSQAAKVIAPKVNKEFIKTWEYPGSWWWNN